MLWPQGDGNALFLQCSLCLQEWSYERACCAGCGKKKATDGLEYYSATGFDHIHLQICQGCRIYYCLTDLAKDRKAVPDVDELAALTLDVWAQEQGYQKLRPNFAGI